MGSVLARAAGLSDLRREVWHFLLHLRWPYQVVACSGAYLLGGLFQPELTAGRFLVQYANVHLLLLGGATVYNSFWDRDDGPIGGLEHPPPLAPWTRRASVVVQLVGAAAAYPAGARFLGVYLISALLFWLYSAPYSRWKGDPHKSLVVVGVGNGVNLFLLGYLAAGAEPVRLQVLAAAGGVALILLSLYPTSPVPSVTTKARVPSRLKAT